MPITIEAARKVAAAGDDLQRARAWAKKIRAASKVRVFLEFPSGRYEPESVQVLHDAPSGEVADVIHGQLVKIADRNVAAAERKLRQLGAEVPD